MNRRPHPKDGWPVREFTIQDELLAWLDEHHGDPVDAAKAHRRWGCSGRTAAVAAGGRR